MVERYKFITFIIQVVIFIIVLLHQNKQRFDLKLMDVAREKKPLSSRCGNKKKITEVPSASGAEQIEFETSVVWTS